MKKPGTRSRPASAPSRSRSERSVFPEPEAVTRAITKAMREAVLRHKALGQSIYEWRDGRVVEIPASKIRVPRAPAARGSRRTR
jgi:hypothetical protein